jgi:archaemetzincin
MHITVVLLGHTVPGLPHLLDRLAKAFDASVTYQFIDFPFTRSFKSGRGQYDAELLLKEFSHSMGGGTERLLILMREDIFALGKESVFGHSFSRCSAVSLARLDPRFYGEVPVLADGATFLKERMEKESLHELGHTFRLGHCDDKGCLMALSDSIQDVDSKQGEFCERCSNLIKQFRDKISL